VYKMLAVVAKAHLHVILFVLLFIYVSMSFHSAVPSSRVNCRQHFFAVGVTDVWNSLPEDVVSVNNYRCCL